jgi:hypothetical protein
VVWSVTFVPPPSQLSAGRANQHSRTVVASTILFAPTSLTITSDQSIDLSSVIRPAHHGSDARIRLVLPQRMVIVANHQVSGRAVWKTTTRAGRDPEWTRIRVTRGGLRGKGNRYHSLRWFGWFGAGLAGLARLGRLWSVRLVVCSRHLSLSSGRLFVWSSSSVQLFVCSSSSGCLGREDTISSLVWLV